MRPSYFIFSSFTPAIQEQTLVESRRCRASDAVSHTLQSVVVDGGVHRPELELALSRLWMRRYVTINHCGKKPHSIAEGRNGVEPFHEHLH